MIIPDSDLILQAQIHIRREQVLAELQARRSEAATDSQGRPTPGH